LRIEKLLELPLQDPLAALQVAPNRVGLVVMFEVVSAVRGRASVEKDTVEVLCKGRGDEVTGGETGSGRVLLFVSVEHP